MTYKVCILWKYPDIQGRMYSIVQICCVKHPAIYSNMYHRVVLYGMSFHTVGYTM